MVQGHVLRWTRVITCSHFARWGSKVLKWKCNTEVNVYLYYQWVIKIYQEKKRNKSKRFLRKINTNVYTLALNELGSKQPALFLSRVTSQEWLSMAALQLKTGLNITVNFYVRKRKNLCDQFATKGFFRSCFYSEVHVQWAWMDAWCVIIVV